MTYVKLISSTHKAIEGRKENTPKKRQPTLGR